ncbi:hypothetical protein WAF17_06720 [Bernardetia sp. ABR2-2B]|uniref:hypothetical protein n=1 Tax=Bernardetia sp. ABR2-2B TaxID=3127472 RepID=UPI0030D62F0D
MRYLILFLLANLICFSVSAQVFFKQRVYGNEKREKNVSSTIEVESSVQMGTISLNKKKYSLYSNHTSEWKENPIRFHRRTGTFYLEDEKKAISMTAGRNLMKELGEKKLVQAIDKSKVGTGVGRVIQGVGLVFGASGVLLTLGSGSEIGLAGILMGGAGWYGGRQLVIFSRNPIRNRLVDYNSRLADIKKNFYPSFKPSKITFKPVQISPFTPSLAPTLGFSWKL